MFPGGLQNWSQGGKGQGRGLQNMGRTWEETYPLLDTAIPAVRALLEAINRSRRSGLIIWDVQHPYWHRRMGVGGGTPLAHSPVQLVTQPENFAAWSVTGTPVLTAGQSDPFGTVAAYLVDDNDGAAFETIFLVVSFTGNGEKAFSLFVRQGTSASSWFRLRDTTAATDRHTIGISWSGGVPTLSTLVGAGERFPVENFGNGWWRVSGTATGIVAANNNVFEYGPAAFTAASTGTGFIFGANAWNDTTYGPYRGPTSPGPSGFPTTQEGSLLFVRGAPVSTTAWLRAGDLIDIVGAPVVLDVTGQVDTNTKGGAQIPISPPLFSGIFLPDAAAVTVDPTAIFFSAAIVQVQDYPSMDTTRYIDPGLTITWREQPA